MADCPEPRKRLADALDAYLAGREADEAASGVTRELPFLEAGHAPSEGSKMVFFKVPKNSADLFEASNLSMADRLRTFGIADAEDRILHVLPQPDDGETVLYALEAPNAGLPTKALYSERANQALGVLKGGKAAAARFQDYASPISTPQSLPGTSKAFKVPEGLRAGLPDAESLNNLPPQEKAAALRQALIYDYRTPDIMAEPLERGRTTAQAAKRAARQGDQVESVKQAIEHEKASLEVLESAAQAADEARESIRAAILAKVATGTTARRAPIHPPDPEAWRRIIRDLSIADVADLPGESMILTDADKSLNVIITRRTKEVNVHVAPEAPLEELTVRQGEIRRKAGVVLNQLKKVKDPVARRELQAELSALRRQARELPDPQAAEAQLRVLRDEQGFPVKTQDEFFDVTVVNRHGETLDYTFEGSPIVVNRPRTKTETAAAELAEKITNMEGFAKSPVEYTAYTNYIHEADTKLVASISFQKGRQGTTKGQAFVVNFFEIQPDGILRKLNLDEMPFKRGFKSEEEALALLTDLRYRAKSDTPYHYFTALRRVRTTVPDPSTASARELHSQHSRLTLATLQYMQDRRVLSRDLKTYLQDFGRAWVNTGLKRPPFNAKIRDALGAVTIQDLRPGTFEEFGRGLGGGQVSKGTGALSKQGPAGSESWTDSWIAHEGAPSVTSDASEGVVSGGGPTGPWPEEVWRYHDRPLHPERLQEWKQLLDQQHTLEQIADVEPVIRPEPTAHTLGTQKYAKLKDGRTVRVVDPRPGESGMLVETFDGQSFTVPHSEADIVRGPRQDLYWAKLRRVADGEVAGAPGFVAPGLGEWERRVGLVGVQNRAVLRQRMQKDLEQMLEGMHATRHTTGEFRGKKGGPFRFRGSDQQFQDLLGVYRRALELDIGDLVGQLPENLKRPLKWAVYKAVQAEQGGHPIADLASRALLGEIDQAEGILIDRWAAQFGLGGVNKATQVQGLIDRGQIDHMAAKLMFRLKNDIGKFGWWGTEPGAGDIRGRIVIRDRSLPNDLWAYGHALDWHIPHKAARRHPTSNGMINTVYKAVENEARYREKASQLLLAMETSGIRSNSDDFIKLRNWVEQFDDWDAALKGGVPKRFAESFSELRQWLEKTRFDVVWLRMKRGFQARPIRRNADGTIYWEDQYLLSRGGVFEDLGIDPMNPPKDFMIMDDLRRAEGVIPDDEIDEFVFQLQQYGTADEFRAANPAGKQWMVEQFDFWKNWKIKNFWPYIHEGNFVVFAVDEAGKETTKAFASSMMDAIELIRFGVKSNKLAASGKYGIREIAVTMDDVLQQIVPRHKYDRIVGSISKATSMTPDEVSAIITAEAGALAPGPSGQRAPWLAHAEKRLADLRPLKDDPVTEILLYNARIGRAKYKYEIASGVERWIRADEKLSRAFGVDPLNLRLLSDRQSGPWQNLATLMKDEIDAALGRYTKQDAAADFLIGLRNMMIQGPKETLRFAKGESPLRFWDLLKVTHYTKPFSGRKYAGDIIGLQAMLKLGASPTSAFVNLTQTLINTAPHIGTVNTLRGIKEAGDFLTAGTKFSRLKIDSEEYRLLKELADEAGIAYMPAKQVAGPGWADQIGGKVTKLARLDAAAFDPTNSLSQQWAAKFRRNMGVAFDWTQYNVMRMFNGAEKINRMSTLFGGYRHARLPVNEGGMGLADDAARAWAKQLVTDTQFLYTTQAMPMFMKGPIARVLFQFKPFVVNQLSFEKDLILKLAKNPGNLKEWGAMATHIGWYSLFGGVRGLVNHPALMFIAGPMALMGAGTLEDKLLARNRHEKDRQEPGLFTGSANFTLRDAVVHGAFGLVGGSLGQRIGVSGQELTADNFVMGPHVSLLADWYKALLEYYKSGDAEPGIAGYAAFAAASGFAGATQRYAPMIAGALGGVLASSFSNNPMDDFITRSKQGRAAWQSFLPSQLTRFIRTLELFAYGAPRDISFRPLHQPYAVNKTEHALWTLLGGSTLDDAEARAYQSLLLSDGERYRSRRALVAEELANALVSGNIEDYHRIAANAAQRGMVFDYSDLQDRIERMVIPATESVRKSQPVGARLPFLK